MDRAEREGHHQANLERIQQVQRVCGRGDRTRIDHEATVLERARLTEEEICSHRATELGLAALERLLRVTEEARLRHCGDVIAFLAMVRDNGALPLRLLRGLDAPLADDMLAVLDAYRHARLDLLAHVPGGPQRVARALRPRPRRQPA